MKKYKVKVNGTVYEVELEEILSNNEHITSNDGDVEVTKDGGYKVLSFMQGVIVDLKVTEGQRIDEGQTLAILEAMKMENEIVSPVSGTVSKIYVHKNDTVENQEVLMIIK